MNTTNRLKGLARKCESILQDGHHVYINYKILNGQKTWFINWRNYNRKPLKTSKQYKYLKNKFKEEPNKATRLKKCLFIKSYKEEGEKLSKNNLQNKKTSF